VIEVCTCLLLVLIFTADGSVKEAARFMRHGRRTTLTTSDIDLALRVLNIEPLYGHSPHAPPSFRRAPPVYLPNQPGSALHPSSSQAQNQSSVWFVEDEEIDFDNLGLGRGLREEKIQLPKPVSWTAHWLAVEGVQPLIPENPPPIPRDVPEHETGTLANVVKDPKQQAIPGVTPLPGAAGSQVSKLGGGQQHLVKQVLSRELQLYYTRLTSSLLPPSTGEADTLKRTAALASLRHDAGLQALLPYLVRWVGEGVVGALKDGAQSDMDGRVLEVLLDVIGALLDNNTLFVEPYVRSISYSFQIALTEGAILISYINSFRQFSLPSSTPPFPSALQGISVHPPPPHYHIF
jgi:transcription initiation factor TFIID subunit 6